MADPFTMAVIGTTAAVAGGGLSAYGAEAKGSADQAMYNYQSGVAKLNAAISKQNADYTRTAGETVAVQSGFKTADLVARQKVAQGASGVDVNSGSPQAIRDTTTKFGQMDQATIRTNNAKRAYGYEVEAVTKEAEAGADVIAGGQARKAADISAASSILGTVSSVAGKWYGASPSFGGASQGITLYNPQQQASGWIA